ncbi:hypothetical protein Taro_009726 [Colocasia esculenta]|uniref:Pseudo-response regulator 7 n=1 Tax=Colocasia esculenta TaxID=4460 RepID=A0A843U7E7_COLES|nr:hypothetical protein [Colocasia esculenta]
MQEEEPNEAGDDVVGEGQGLSERDESMINVREGVNDGCGGGDDGPVRQTEVHISRPQLQQQPQHQDRQQQQQVLQPPPPPPPPCPVVRWERFLPVRTLKVLLVENDDSTRQVVSALLRNCSYEVIAVANGLEAWKVLEDLTNHIDIVLTEVSSGSGSESAIQTQNSVKSENAVDSDNTGSNDEDDNTSIRLNMRDGSDNGSGTQSSWTKQVAEPDSPQPSSPSDQLAEAPDSTCAQVIHPKPEIFCNDWVPTCSEYREQKEQLDDVCLQKDLEIGKPRSTYVQLESYPPSEIASTNLSSSKIENTKKNSHQPDDNLRGLDGKNATCVLTTQAADLIGSISKDLTVSASAQASNALNKMVEDKEKVVADAKELPYLELSLKRLRSIGGGGIASNDDRYVLRRSDQSAFSRYGASAAARHKPAVHGAGCSVPSDNGSDAVKTESMYMHTKQSVDPFNQILNGSCNIKDMGSTANNVFNKPAAFNENISSPSTMKASSAFHPVKQKNYATQCATAENADNMASNKTTEETRASHNVRVQHHHHHYHHHHHHVHVGQQHLQQVQPPSDDDELSVKNMAAAAPQCGSSNMFKGSIEANVGNYSVNGSVSGSNHGSNGQNGNSTANPAGTNIESENGLIGKNEAGGYKGSGSGSGSGVDQNRSAQRVAALTKFRQKRKQRCFQKKVRYQSRKKLAEQRPRVHGQFVRQIIRERTSREADN